jgi:hypothetical protein
MKSVKLVLGLSLLAALSSQSAFAGPCDGLSGTPLAACLAAQPKVPTCTTTYTVAPNACAGVPFPYYQACLNSAPKNYPVTVCK